jgi:hypothetical protein
MRLWIGLLALLVLLSLAAQSLAAASNKEKIERSLQGARDRLASQLESEQLQLETLRLLEERMREIDVQFTSVFDDNVQQELEGEGED